MLDSLMRGVGDFMMWLALILAIVLIIRWSFFKKDPKDPPRQIEYPDDYAERLVARYDREREAQRIADAVEEGHRRAHKKKGWLD